MSSREANIERLNYAITSLNEDAEDIHELIARSADGLERATAAGNRAADNATQVIEALTPLTETLNVQHRNSTVMLEEARKASEEQRVATAEQTAFLKDAVEKTLEGVRKKTETACDELTKTVESTFGKIGKTQAEAFDDIKTKTLKEHERTRDELQTDMLSFKNATSSRLDALEAETTKTQNAIRELEARIADNANALGKKLLGPLCISIVLGIANLICLIVFLTR